MLKHETSERPDDTSGGNQNVSGLLNSEGPPCILQILSLCANEAGKIELQRGNKRKANRRLMPF